MKNKKGSMELGINAIVVLIIALALLGLGIGFVTKLFTASQNKMVRIIDRTELPIHADSLNPVVFDATNLEVKAGKDETLIVSVYNDGNTEAPDAYIQDFGSCIDRNGYPAYGSISIVSPRQAIAPGVDAGFSVIVKVASTAAKGSYICTVGAQLFNTGGETSTPSTQLFINVI